MDRRNFGAVLGAGIVGSLLPQKVEAVSVEPVLRGLTDLGMAQKIAEFPQGPETYLDAESIEITHPWGPPFLRRAWRITLREKSWICPGLRSEWMVPNGGVTIHNTVYSPVYDPKTYMIDISLLQQIRIYSKYDRHRMIQYHRLAVGWFTLDSGA